MNTRKDDQSVSQNHVVLEENVSEPREANIKARGNSYQDAGNHTAIIMGPPSMAKPKAQSKEEIIEEYLKEQAEDKPMTKEEVIAEYLAEQEAKELQELTDKANAEEEARLAKAEEASKKKTSK